MKKVKCIEPYDFQYGNILTLGKIYEVIEEQDNFWYKIKSNGEKLGLFPMFRFEEISGTDIHTKYSIGQTIYHPLHTYNQNTIPCPLCTEGEKAFYYTNIVTCPACHNRRVLTEEGNFTWEVKEYVIEDIHIDIFKENQTIWYHAVDNKNNGFSFIEIEIYADKETLQKECDKRNNKK
jgi:hypothetical protein